MAKTLQNIPESKFWGKPRQMILEQTHRKLKKYLIKLVLKLGIVRANESMIQEIDQDSNISQEEIEINDYIRLEDIKTDENPENLH